MVKKFDWNQIREWDKKYYITPLLTSKEWDAGYKTAERVDEQYVYTPDGTKVLDMVSENRCCHVGLIHRKIKEAIRSATEDFGFVGETSFGSPYRAIASKILVADILGSDNWCGGVRFCNSGSEAVEMALQIAKLYTQRPNIITRQWAYHGWTLGAGACTRLRSLGRYLSSDTETWIRNIPSTDVAGVYVAPGNNCYRCSLGHRYPDCKRADGMLSCVALTESLIRSIGPETIAAMITEVVYGTSGIVPAPEYFPQLVRMLNKHGIMWIDDEIICGFGKLGTWFGYNKYGDGAVPDIMVMGKGIVSAQLPAAGVAVNRDIAKMLQENRWNLHTTYSSHPVVMAAVAANLEILIEDKVVEHSARVGEYMGDRLFDLQKKHKCVGQFAGAGTLWTGELVKNRETREPFVLEDRDKVVGHDFADWPVNIVSRAAREKGVYFGSFNPNCLNISPQCTISEEQIDMAMGALDYGLSAIDKMCT